MKATEGETVARTSAADSGPGVGVDVGVSVGVGVGLGVLVGVGVADGAGEAVGVSVGASFAVQPNNMTVASNIRPTKKIQPATRLTGYSTRNPYLVALIWHILF
jgi:hypothetical protein